MPEGQSYQHISVSFMICVPWHVSIIDGAIPPIRQYLLTPQEGPSLLIYYSANNQEAATSTNMSLIQRWHLRPREGRCDPQGHSVSLVSSLLVIPRGTVNG